MNANNSNNPSSVTRPSGSKPSGSINSIEFLSRANGENKRKSRVEIDSSSDGSVFEIATEKVSQVTQDATDASVSESQSPEDMQI